MWRWFIGVVCGLLAAMGLGAYGEFQQQIAIRKKLHITTEEEEQLWDEAMRGLLALDRLNRASGGPSLVIARREACVPRD